MTLCRWAALLLGTWMFASSASAETALVLRKFDFEFGKYSDTSRDGYILVEKPNEKLDTRPKIDFDWDFYCTASEEFCVYLNQSILGKSTSRQYRYVSWILEGGFAFRKLDFFYWHQSQHSLEAVALSGRYPNENVFGVRLKLINNPRKGWGL